MDGHHFHGLRRMGMERLSGCSQMQQIYLWSKESHNLAALKRTMAYDITGTVITFLGDNVSKPTFIPRGHFIERVVRIRVNEKDIQASDEDSILNCGQDITLCNEIRSAILF